MPLSPALVLMLASHCAPAVAPETLVSVVRVESGFDPLVIGVNGPKPRRIHPASLPDAVTAATDLLARGANIDLGLGQINSANLGRLGLNVTDAFEPCRNLRAAGQILQQAYQGQAPGSGHEQSALRAALSIYNTGRTDRGFRNGYVAKVSAAAELAVPALTPHEPETPPPPTPTWDVFAAPRSLGRLVFTAAYSGDRP